MRFVKCLCFFSASILLIVSMAYAQAPTFDSTVYAFRSNWNVVLQWDAAVGADGYNIYRFEDLPIPSPLGTPLATVTDLSYWDQDAVNWPPYRYYYLVTAFNANGETPAPNLAFKFNYELQYVANQSNRNYISLPYIYIPMGQGVPATAGHLCHEIEETNGGMGPASIQRGDTEFCHIAGNPCLTISSINFELVPGQGYAVVPISDGMTVPLIGSHDPDMHPGGPESVGLIPWEDCECTYNPVSVPYHTTAETAEDICAEVGAAPSDIIARFDTELDTMVSHLCGSPLKNFSIVTGESLILRTYATSWQPDVYR